MQPILQGFYKRPVVEAILHCAAISTGQFDGMSAIEVRKEIDGWHRKRGFTRGFGYHFLIMPHGYVLRGRPLFVEGAHCKDQGKNKGTAGILLIEKKKIEVPAGLNEKKWLEGNTFDTFYTQEQREALRDTLASIPGLLRVRGHNDYAQRLCPGFKVRSQDWL